jgi:hypothetical protein
MTMMRTLLTVPDDQEHEKEKKDDEYDRDRNRQRLLQAVSVIRVIATTVGLARR